MAAEYSSYLPLIEPDNQSIGTPVTLKDYRNYLRSLKHLVPCDLCMTDVPAPSYERHVNDQHDFKVSEGCAWCYAKFDTEKCPSSSTTTTTGSSDDTDNDDTRSHFYAHLKECAATYINVPYMVLPLLQRNLRPSTGNHRTDSCITLRGRKLYLERDDSLLDLSNEEWNKVQAHWGNWARVTVICISQQQAPNYNNYCLNSLNHEDEEDPLSDSSSTSTLPYETEQQEEEEEGRRDVEEEWW